MLIPPLPIKQAKLIEKSLFKQQKKLQRFLQGIARSEQLKACKFFSDFLTIQDRKEWEKVIKNQEKTKHSRDLADVPTIDGMADVSINQSSSLFCTKMQPFIDSYQSVYVDIIKITEDVHT